TTSYSAKVGGTTITNTGTGGDLPDAETSTISAAVHGNSSAANATTSRKVKSPHIPDENIAAQMVDGDRDTPQLKGGEQFHDTAVVEGTLMEELQLVLGNMTILKKVLECCGGKWASWHEIDDLYKMKYDHGDKDHLAPEPQQPHQHSHAEVPKMAESYSVLMRPRSTSSPSRSCSPVGHGPHTFKNKSREILGAALAADHVLDKSTTIELLSRRAGANEKQVFEDTVLSHLLSLNLHDLARQVQHMYEIAAPNVCMIEVERLEYLFTEAEDKTEAVTRLLHFQPPQAVRFAFALLDRFTLIRHRLLFCRMLLQHLRSWLSDAQIVRLEILCASLELLSVVEQPVSSTTSSRSRQLSSAAAK
ncbi:unnamed protein product, partial [Amoebophrya sp. A120]